MYFYPYQEIKPLAGILYYTYYVYTYVQADIHVGLGTNLFTQLRQYMRL